MALNTNHTVEDLNEVKCAIVEKSISKERADFLQKLLEGNGYTVVVVTAAPPKASKAAAATAESTPNTEVSEEKPAEAPKLTLGVTDVRFNAVNAVFGRSLRASDGHIVTLAYWNQTDAVSHDDIPYYETGK